MYNGGEEVLLRHPMTKPNPTTWRASTSVLALVVVATIGFALPTSGTNLARAASLSRLAACAGLTPIASIATFAVAALSPCPPPVPPPAPPQPPLYTTMNWGAYVGDLTTDAETFEWLVGRLLNMQSLFTGWGATKGPFPSQFGPTIRDRSKTMVLFWEPYGTTLDSIIAGSSDAYIGQFAADARAYGGPIILAPFREMNGNWVPWGGTVGTNTPAKVIAAWQRVHDVFGSVPNVKFAWTVNNVSVPNTPENAIGVYYPGDSYVDYVAVDGFNWGNPWQTFDQVFGQALATLNAYGKPVYILSMASAAGTQKAAWIADMFTQLRLTHPEVQGWVWFNQNKERDWRVNSDAASLQAFHDGIPVIDIEP